MTIINTVAHMDWRELARRVRDEVGQIDALIVDAPYSERTHKGHDGGTAAANRVANWAANAGSSKPLAASKLAQATAHGSARRQIEYAPWGPADVAAFVEAWAPLTRGWLVSLTDHALAPAWASALESAGRYVFSPIACIEMGGRVRMTGDGPSQWACWAVVSRPSDGAWLDAWRESRRGRDAVCSLRGAHVIGGKQGTVGEKRAGRRNEESGRVEGGKPIALMEALVDDYSEPGDLVADPCCGGGTTLLAAKLLGRRYIGGDLDEAHVEIARERLRANPTKPKAGTMALPWGDE